MKRIGQFFVVGLLCVATQTSAYAISVVSDALSAKWGYTKATSITSAGGRGEFIIDGYLSLGSRGSHGDEGAIVGVIAQQIVEHGGWFCPYHIQCGNGKRNQLSWLLYYRPYGYADSKCAWLCEKGYSGPNCEKQYTEDGSKKNVNVISNMRSGIARWQEGGNRSDLSGQVQGFYSWEYHFKPTAKNDRGEHNVLLGVVDFLKNGVKVAPVQVGCQWNNWRYIDSWVQRADAMTTKYTLLCKQGFQPNATNTDCEYATADMLEDINPIFCGNFPEEYYKPELHRLKKNEEAGCYIYLCKDPTKAFTALGKVDVCEDCATSIRGGPSLVDGTCVVCNRPGQYFDANSSTCKSAQGYSSQDLQYGKGQGKGSYKNDIYGQCWTKTSPADYRICVKSGGKLTVEDLEEAQEGFSNIK